MTSLERNGYIQTIPVNVYSTLAQHLILTAKVRAFIDRYDNVSVSVSGGACVCVCV